MSSHEIASAMVADITAIDTQIDKGVDYTLGIGPDHKNFDKGISRILVLMNQRHVMVEMARVTCQFIDQLASRSHRNEYARDIAEATGMDFKTIFMEMGI